MFVLVFNIDDLDSYNQIKQLQDLILELKKTKQKESKKKIPILILANKKDRLLEKRLANRANEHSSSENHQINASAFKSSLYFEISCKQSLGIENAFEKLFLIANLPIEMLPTRHRRVSLNLDLARPQFSTKFRNSRFQSEPNEPFALLNSDKESIPTKHSQTERKLMSDVNNEGAVSASAALGKSSERGSFKITAKKSFRKMTFRPKLVEACGTVWMNARRPSIRSELKMLNTKTDNNFFYHRHQSVDNKLVLNSNYKRNGSVSQVLSQKIRKLFGCFQNSKEKK